jgi:AraC-like DNA-binding protein
MGQKHLRYETPGFHFEWPDEVPEIFHIGERWTSGFFIGGHKHHVWEFYYQVSGQSVWSAPDYARLDGSDFELVRGGPTAREVEAEASLRQYVLEAGGFFAVAPHVPHRMRERVTSKQHFLYAAFDLAVVLERHPALKVLWEAQQVVFSPHGASLQMPFRTLIREISTQLPQRAVGMRLALDLLVVEASRLLEQTPRASLLNHNRAVARARELMEEQPQRAWTLRDLAHLTGTSVGHLSQCFTRDVGVPPHRYLLQMRIERAQELLKSTDVPITQLALELGFGSSQHFAGTFKKLTGVTAQQYRAQR